MFDVLPPSGKPKRSTDVVQLSWKLPARLRKPIRQELARQRAKKKAHKAMVQFNRRPISTHPPQKVLALPTHRFSAARTRSTRDTHTQTRPKLRLSPPPYRSNIPRARPPVQIIQERDAPIRWANTSRPGSAVPSVNNDLFVRVEKTHQKPIIPISFSILPQKLLSYIGLSSTSKKKTARTE